MLVDDVIARLSAIPDLAHRCEGAAELARLVNDGVMPQATPFAYVLPTGFRAAPADAVAGLYRQNYDETIGVVLVVAVAGDATGGAAIAPVHVLRDQIIQALAGWGPDTDEAVLEPRAGNLVSLVAGTVIYQIDFVLRQQLRISR